MSKIRPQVLVMIVLSGAMGLFALQTGNVEVVTGIIGFWGGVATDLNTGD